MRVYLTLFLTACWLVVPAQPKELTGFLKDAATGEPLHGAHIQNMTTRMVTTSSVNGTFRMPVTAGDSIRITFVGYETYAFAVKPAHIEQAQPIDLEPAQVALDDVVVTPLPDYWRFKQMVADTDPPKDSVMTFDLPQVTAQYFYDPRDEPAGQRNLHAPSIGIGFNIKSRKENKERKALEQQALLKKARKKFNRDWVAQTTQLKGDELTDFIAYCNFSPEHIVKTPLYDLHQEMMALLDDFRGNAPKDSRYAPG